MHDLQLSAEEREISAETCCRREAGHSSTVVKSYRHLETIHVISTVDYRLIIMPIAWDLQYHRDTITIWIPGGIQITLNMQMATLTMG